MMTTMMRDSPFGLLLQNHKVVRSLQCSQVLVLWLQNIAEIEKQTFTVLAATLCFAGSHTFRDV